MVGRLMESGTYLGAEYRLESRADQVISLLVSPIDPEMLVSYFHILLACASRVQICAEMIAPLFFFSYYLFFITFFPTYSAFRHQHSRMYGLAHNGFRYSGNSKSKLHRSIRARLPNQRAEFTAHLLWRSLPNESRISWMRWQRGSGRLII